MLPIHGKVVRRWLRTAVVALCIVSLQADAAPGDFDTTLGGTGRFLSAIGTAADRARRVAIQPDGKIVVAGTCGTVSGSEFCVARYTATGTFDPTFDGDGKVLTAPGAVASGNELRALALQPDGKIVVAGSCFIGGSNFEICLLRYTENGALDTTFNATGKVRTQAGSTTSSARSLAIQPDGKILVGGECDTATDPSSFCVLRYNSNGSLDLGFSGDGKVVTPMGGSDSNVYEVLLQPDGRIVVAGRCTESPTIKFCLARYLSGGALDLSFSTDGKAIAQAGNGLTTAVGGAALQPDGKIVVASICLSTSPTYQLCVARFTSSGALDLSFSANGEVLAAIHSNDTYFGGQGVQVALQTDGKIVATRPCSTSTDIFNGEFCLVRFSASGALDTNFSIDGKVVSSIGSAFDQPNDLAVQLDGKLVVVGQCSDGSSDNFCLARYEGGPFDARNCSLDIDGDGRTTATVDGLIATRVMLGMTGSAVIGGIAFAAHAARSEWGTDSARDIRRHLISQCGISLP
jgi:uncharacterized delta-60 repeat protein